MDAVSGVENSPLNGVCNGQTAQVFSIRGRILADGESIVRITPLGRKFATANKPRLLPTFYDFSPPQTASRQSPDRYTTIFFVLSCPVLYDLIFCFKPIRGLMTRIYSLLPFPAENGERRSFVSSTVSDKIQTSFTLENSGS